jgi:hypothetical protein
MFIEAKTWKLIESKERSLHNTPKLLDVRIDFSFSAGFQQSVEGETSSLASLGTLLDREWPNAGWLRNISGS